MLPEVRVSVRQIATILFQQLRLQLSLSNYMFASPLYVLRQLELDVHCKAAHAYMHSLTFCEIQLRLLQSHLATWYCIHQCAHPIHTNEVLIRTLQYIIVSQLLALSFLKLHMTVLRLLVYPRLTDIMHQALRLNKGVWVNTLLFSRFSLEKTFKSLLVIYDQRECVQPIEWVTPVILLGHQAAAWSSWLPEWSNSSHNASQPGTGKASLLTSRTYPTNLTRVTILHIQVHCRCGLL